MTIFSEAELEYLTSGRKLARVATVGPDGTPHVTPVVMVSYDNETGAVDITGQSFDTTKKFRDVQRTGKAALVVDDMTEEPWQPRAVEIRGDAEAIEGTEPKIRLWPTRIVSWGVDQANERTARSIPS